MKVGIDGNDKEVLRVIKEKIIEKANLVIDLSEITAVNKGELIYRKVLIANITKINCCICIDVEDDENINHITILYDNCECGILKSREVLGIISKGMNNIDYKEGNNLYFIEMTDCPVIKIIIPKSYKKEFIDNYLDLVVSKIIE